MTKKELEQIEEEEVETTEEEEVEEEETEEDAEETEEDVKEQLKQFIQNETSASSEKAIDSILDKKAEELVSKFFAGVDKQRAVATKGSKKPKNLTEQEQVRKWFGALMEKDVRTLKTMEKDYLNTGDDDKGGYLVPPALVAEVNRFVEEYGVARRDMRYMPFSGAGNSRKIPALLSSVSAFWVGEGAKKPSTVPSFKLVEQTLKKLVAICPMTEEILEDSDIDVIRLLGELFAEAVAYEEDRVFLAGDVGEGDPFTGVINVAGTVPVTIGSDNPEAEDFGNYLVDAMNKALYAVPTQVRNKGTFYLHSEYFGVIQRVKDENGNYIVQQPTGDKPAMIWNRPIVLTDVLPTLDAEGDETPIAFFTDLAKTCVYGDKGGLRVKYLTEATVSSAGESPSSINLAEEDLVALRIVKRTGYCALLPQGIAVLQLGEESI